MPKYKGNMGQICIDGMNTLDHHDDGVPNQQIPKLGTHSHLNENPPIAYGSALEHCLIWIYNLRINHPCKDILMLPDDISAAFHQMFYHPSMMPVFALVFGCHLCIPASSIFGSCSLPGFYILAGELCAWAAGAINFWAAQACLMLDTVFPPEPTPTEVEGFQPALPNSFNLGAAVLTQHGMSALYLIFIDDTGNANTQSAIYNTVTTSILAAYLLFGFPGGDVWGNCPPCINAQKWMVQLQHWVTFLGFKINTQAMTLTWLLDKHQCLQQHITTIMEYFHAGGC